MEYVIAICLSIVINLWITINLLINFNNTIFDELLKERKKIIVIRVILQGLLEGRDKGKLLQLYEDRLRELEEGE